MDFFEPLVRDGYEWVNCVNQADYEVFAGFDGSPRAGALEADPCSPGPRGRAS
jgi:hypothetical protein